jgi:putative nucleotidyltransferase with HDIG domain
VHCGIEHSPATFEALVPDVNTARTRRADDLRQVPVRREVSLRLVVMLNNDNVSVREISTLVSSDPGLASRVLRLANSAYFGLNRRVANINRAILLLGFSVLRALAASIASGMLVTSQSGTVSSIFWEHSVMVAAGTALAARFAGRSPGEAFTAGLLHDLGAASAALEISTTPGPTAPEWWHPAVNDPLIRDASASSSRVINADSCFEDAIFDANHAESGASLLEEWGLPWPIVDAVRHHHDGRTSAGHSLVDLVIVGEALGTAFARLHTAKHPPLRPLSDDDENSHIDIALDTETSIVDEFVVPTLARARLARIHPTDVLQALRAESARLRTLLEIAR